MRCLPRDRTCSIRLSVKTPGCSLNQAFAPRVRAVSETIDLPLSAVFNASANRLTSGPSGIRTPACGTLSHINARGYLTSIHPRTNLTALKTNMTMADKITPVGISKRVALLKAVFTSFGTSVVDTKERR